MEICFETVGRLQRMLESGELTSVALTKAYLTRIDRLNSELNAYITVCSDLALEMAGEADRRRKREKGPFLGIPVALKDVFDVAGLQTTAGSSLLANQIATRDSTVVRKLKNAGAVILGKTNMHEFAYGTTSINPTFGTVKNPWAKDRICGGSSGGSACAVAAGLAPIALGTDTGCSVRQPAHACGLVGLKPGFGVISRNGVFPLVRSLDHVGVLSRDVADATAMLDLLSGLDPKDPYSSTLTPKDEFDVGNHGDPGSIRLAICREMFFEGRPEMIEVAERAIERLAGAGVEMITVELPEVQKAFEAAKTIFAEAGQVLRDIAEKNAEKMSEDVYRKATARSSVGVEDYIDAQHFRHVFSNRIHRALEGFDGLIAPTSTAKTPRAQDIPDDYGLLSWRNCSIFNLTGQPSISLPCGFTDEGMPVGLMLTGRRNGDVALVNVAKCLERTLQDKVTSEPVTWNGPEINKLRG
ncbi:Asp-tRNA(Asn)/Glu-tRNA(Gln) amidotransferase GatCAB subunit A [Leisingera methylohalidivorans]|uniref:Amidase domain-containing protein n=1 Tax=Leisingera methylohalidivorans DSM 14336 TaxID=999552 RepID=V9W218_9RHOB|nr:Asp-tRNA(Asn)/Glu-tRNA(Gln) amidotransferase GatCAB subunit A [Leisingera methylohalidivorans]AHD03222.1 hypothetical protein METH_16975 [Leisingera methylohalidivorans DSM 14336]